VRSYSLAMDYFKTYLKMNDIGSSGGKFGKFRVARDATRAMERRRLRREGERI
jgi:hypothetical protein